MYIFIGEFHPTLGVHKIQRGVKSSYQTQNWGEIIRLTVGVHDLKKSSNKDSH